MTLTFEFVDRSEGLVVLYVIPFLVALSITFEILTFVLYPASHQHRLD
jgi:hypothetical protein